ncbi:unnamed protein product, partial [Brassica rapa subsp. trilocularis]
FHSLNILYFSLSLSLSGSTLRGFAKTEDSKSFWIRKCLILCNLWFPFEVKLLDSPSSKPNLGTFMEPVRSSVRER